MGPAPTPTLRADSLLEGISGRSLPLTGTNGTPSNSRLITATAVEGPITVRGYLTWISWPIPASIFRDLSCQAGLIPRESERPHLAEQDLQGHSTGHGSPGRIRGI